MNMKSDISRYPIDGKKPKSFIVRFKKHIGSIQRHINNIMSGCDPITGERLPRGMREYK